MEWKAKRGERVVRVLETACMGVGEHKGLETMESKAKRKVTARGTGKKELEEKGSRENRKR